MAIPVPVAYLQMKTGYVIMKKSPEVLKMTKLYLANTEPLADPDLFERFYRTVPCHRKEKIDTIKFPKGKRQCLGAWILLAYALKEAGIHLPIVAIGGITEADIPELMQTGVNGIALSGSILRAKNPIEEMKKIMTLIM